MGCAKRRPPSAGMRGVVILIGGGSNLGKTTAAAQLSVALGADHIEVDALRAELNGSSEDSFAGPDVWRRPVDELFQCLVESTFRIAEPLARVIEGHAAGGGNVIIEGQGIEPRVLGLIDPVFEVRCVFVIEADPNRIDTKLRDRASTGAARYRALSPLEQRAVLAMNVRYNEWLRAEAERKGLPWVASQPWLTLADRILVATGMATNC